MYHGQFLLDKYLHETFFKDVNGGFFVECGACDGLLESTCLFFEEHMNWKGLNIEASPPLFEMLIKNRPNTNNINIGLSDQDGSFIFTHAVHPSMGQRFGNGSLNHSEIHMKDLQKQGCKFEKYNISCKKFSDIYKENTEIDLFVLDVEGHEIPALSGVLSLEKKYMPRVFCIEYSFCGLESLKNKLCDNYKFHSLHKHNAIFTKYDSSI